MPTAAVPPPAAPLVLLVSVWPGAAGSGCGWHAQVVWPDACSREFDSPFELAQFLSSPPRRSADAPARVGGLR